MKPTWTKEQLEAIEKTNTSIIVSAGAGSGKTAVLTARVLNLLRHHKNINELLILTFTNAAASEMKERIRASIEKDESIKHQLALIDASYIMTFDAFALYIVKKYHYLLNLKPDINIIDNTLINIKKQEFLNDIFDKLYIEKNALFIKLINDFCLKDDKNIKQIILNIYNKLSLLINKKEYLFNYINNYYNDKVIDNNINQYLKIITNKLMLLSEDVKNFLCVVDNKYGQRIEAVLNRIITSTTYDDIKLSLNCKLPNLPNGTEPHIKELKQKITSIINELKVLTSYPNIEEIKKAIYKTKDYVEIIIYIIKELDAVVDNYKRENDTFDFSDIALMSLKLVEENKTIRDELKSSFSEIMIDEYQDTSDIQEYFINLISNNNVYMVGDIKQSIYRFRNANPNIFKNKYDSYKENINGIKIDLFKNFRTRQEPISNINSIFNMIMDNEVGDANYEESHQLVFGNNIYNNQGKTNQNNNLEIYNYQESNDYSKEEIEAFIIATDIKNKVISKYQILDKKTSLLRDAKYSDFAILIDRSSSFVLYKKIFEYMSIPLYIHKDEEITSSYDILVIKNILHLIVLTFNSEYKTNFKYYFTSISRSYLFNYNDDYIFDIIANNKYQDTTIMQKVNKLASLMPSTTITQMINLIIEEFNIYDKLITIGNIENSQKRIERLINITDNLSKLGYTTYNFVSFFQTIIDNEQKIEYTPTKNSEDAVTIMTIHKSKGLEFSICYYSGLYKKFNKQDIKARFSFDESLGIITPYIHEGINNTIYKSILEYNYYKQEVSEKIRLFYVALTRAKEKIIIVTTLTDKTISNNKIPVENRLTYSSFQDILESIYHSLSPYITNIDINKINLSKDYNLIKKSNFKDKIKKSDKVITYKTINIENNIVEENKFSKSVNKVLSTKEKDNMEYGTYMHYLLEIIDFKNPDLSKIDIKYHKTINNLLNQDIFTNIKEATIYKEYQFSYTNNINNYNGIIDLILKYQDKIIIVDYKLKEVDDDNYIKQIAGYKEYLSTKTSLPIYTYLYSIINNELKEIIL
ncbi:MAG: UvrD-helicase domain-containing protein [bacterium]|nr:UvrD-helicase domain-containing protein [bacterium]